MNTNVQVIFWTVVVLISISILKFAFYLMNLSDSLMFAIGILLLVSLGLGLANLIIYFVKKNKVDKPNQEEKTNEKV